jgi:hypothetical protein
MKKALSMLLIVFFSMGFTFLVQSQETEKITFNTKKTEINIAIANVFAKNDIYPYYVYDGTLVLPYYLYYDYSQPKTKLIAGLKYHNPKGAVRLAFEFSYNGRKYENDNNANSSSYKTLEAGMNAGYEWHSTFNRVNIYYGFDMSVAHANYKYFNTINSNEEHTTKSGEISYGVSPLVGVNFFITPNLSIGTEMKFMMEGFSGKTIYEYNGEEQDTDKSSGFRTQFGPLGFLSFNIHF